MNKSNPVNWNKVIAITNILFVLALIATLIYSNRNTALQIRAIDDRGYCDSLIRLSDKWFSDQMNNAKVKVLSIAQIETTHLLGKDDPQLCIAVQEISGFFENLGLQVDRGYIPFKDAFDLLGGSTMRYWDRYRIAIEDLRRVTGRNRYYEWFEDLVKKCKEEEIKS